MDPNSAKPNTNHKFHWLFLQGQQGSAALYDKIIEQTENFAVLPTKGSIVPGWVLIVPKFPATRIADVPEELVGELSDLVCHVSSRLEKEFGPTFSFEHGGHKGSIVSCGVDQAHLHVVPLNFDLIEEAQSVSPYGWIDVNANYVPRLESFSGEYWFVSSGNCSKYKLIDHPCSQFFRKIIARKVGLPSLWNYKEESFLNNIATTINIMESNG